MTVLTKFEGCTCARTRVVNIASKTVIRSLQEKLDLKTHLLWRQDSSLGNELLVRYFGEHVKEEKPPTTNLRRNQSKFQVQLQHRLPSTGPN